MTGQGTHTGRAREHGKCRTLEAESVGEEGRGCLLAGLDGAALKEAHEVEVLHHLQPCLCVDTSASKAVKDCVRHHRRHLNNLKGLCAVPSSTKSTKARQSERGSLCRARERPSQ